VANELIETSLADKTATARTLGELLALFHRDEHLKFTIDPVNLTWRNLSPRIETPLKGKRATLEPAELVNISLVPSTKGGGIVAQANIATDAETYVDLERAHERITRPGRDSEADAFKRFELGIRVHLESWAARSSDPVSPGLSAFLVVMARSLAGQAALPAIAEVKRANKQAFKKRRIPRVDKETLYRSSRVKDSGATWIKDNLISVGLGLLAPPDWQAVLKLIGHPELIHDITRQGLLPPQWDSSSSREDQESYLATPLKLALKQIGARIAELKLANPRQGSGQVRVGPRKRVEFLSHDADWVDPRQDTHIDPQRVQLPNVWADRRLHVVETRRDLADNLRLLEGLDNRLPRARRPAPAPAPDIEWDFDEV
jgi:hypothetical protein